MTSVIEVKWCSQRQWALQQPLCSSSGWAQGMSSGGDPSLVFVFGIVGWNL